MSEANPCSSELKPVVFPTPDFSGINAAPRGNRQRADYIQAAWQANCDKVIEGDVRRSRFNNLSCRIEGRSSKTLLVGAHYDKVSAGRGVADNWSGIMLLTQLQKRFKNTQPAHTIEFVAFAEEETGFYGARAFAASHEASDFIAMINLDTIGLRSLIIGAESSEEIRCNAEQLASTLNIPYEVRRWTAIEGDWKVFKRLGVETLSLHSVDEQTIKKIHSKKDRPGVVKTSYLEAAYQLTANLIADLAGVKD